MDGMSDIRNEIEQRLGVFARPGAKATFGSKRTTAGALRKQLKAQGMTDAADLEWHGISASDPDSTPYWLHEDGSMEKIKASRDGGKAKFGADQIPFWLDALASQVVDQKDLAKKNAQAIADYVIEHGTDAQIKRLVQLAERVGLRVNMSRPGAKATMGKYWVEDGQSNVKQPVKSMREGIQLVSGMHNGVLRYADHGMTSILAYGRGSGGASLTEDGKLHQKHASSRPSAKATFAFPGIVVKEDAQYIYYYPDEDDRATFADEDGKGAYTVKSNRTGKPVSAKTYRSWDEAVSASNAMNEKLPPLKKRKGFARPGAKAAFAVDAGAIAKEILRQLGGGRFMSMVGGKNAFHGNFGGKPGLQVDIGKGAQGGINRLIVTLDPASDTYRMEFWKIAKGGLSTQKVSEASMVYAEDLQRVFTDRTKFYTSMSRPGEKTEMAAIDAGMMDGAGNEVVIRMADGSRATARYNRGTGKWSLKGHADVPAFAKVRDLVAHLTKQGMSRPGAKAKMGRAEDLYRKLNVSVTLANAKEMERLASEALRMPDFMPEGNDWSLHELAEEAGREVLALKSRASRPGAKATAAKPDDKTECADCETEQDKAGLKLMEKADKAVSDKIRTLIKEGKPQDQAVAIALDMKRRGEL